MLRQAEDYLRRDAGRKPVIMTARQAVQTAWDARRIAIQRMERERQDIGKRAAAGRKAAVRAAAEEEARRRAAAEAERLAAERQADQAGIEAERMRVEALARQREAEAAARLKEAAERERSELRARLQQQLNMILETRDTARGLIVSMSGVLFDTAQRTLRPGAREKLAKISGIVLAHPGLKLEVEGHTDSIGGEEYNQRLSERRAESVRSYPVQQGLHTSGITARGFGEARPAASNDNADGRQQNRRVEIVVTGEPITISSLKVAAAPASGR